MTTDNSCVLLAGQHPLLAEAIRGLLETSFDAVVMVADRNSLLESAGRLRPRLAIVELAMGKGDLAGLLAGLRARCPDLRVLVLGMHDETSVAQFVIRAGADRFLDKRRVATDLLPAVAELLGNETHKDEGVPAGLPEPEGVP
jgi:DNA-binding NarL/FixJ family response regulator